jgi:hypothetical protein
MGSDILHHQFWNVDNQAPKQGSLRQMTSVGFSSLIVYLVLHLSALPIGSRGEKQHRQIDERHTSEFRYIITEANSPALQR